MRLSRLTQNEIKGRGQPVKNGVINVRKRVADSDGGCIVLQAGIHGPGKAASTWRGCLRVGGAMRISWTREEVDARLFKIITFTPIAIAPREKCRTRGTMLALA